MGDNVTGVEFYEGLTKPLEVLVGSPDLGLHEGGFEANPQFGGGAYPTKQSSSSYKLLSK